jgi:hypothetical protein
VRRLRLLLIVVGVLVFLAVSSLLARSFNIDGTERSDITSLIRDEAAGDAAKMDAAIDGCRANADCRARNAQLAAELRRPGQVEILQLPSSHSFSLVGSRGFTRVAWATNQNRVPVVQCLRVHRLGNVLTGLSVHLTRLSARIRSDADCPSRF